MKPVRMCKVEAVISRENSEKVVSGLHRAGIAQVDMLSDEELASSGIIREKPFEKAAEVAGLLSRVRAAMDALKPYSPSKPSFLEELLGVTAHEFREVDRIGFERLKADSLSMLDGVEPEIHALAKKLREASDEGGRLSELSRKLQPLKGLNLPISYFAESPLLYSVVGLLDADALGSLPLKLGETFGAEVAYSALGGAIEKPIVSFTVLKGRREELSQALRTVGFEEVKAEGNGTFREEYIRVDSMLADLVEPERIAEGRLGALCDGIFFDLQVLEELLMIEAERCNVSKCFGSTEKAVYIRFWVPKKMCGKLQTLVSAEASDLCIFEVDWEPQDAPTLLDNPPILKPFESLINMYSPPRYNQVDPTAITAPTFVMFFGFMTGDAVYGLVLAALAYRLKRLYGRFSGPLSNFLSIMLWCGLSTMVFGILTGGYLADFLAKYVLRVPTRDMMFVVIDPLYKSNSVILLTIAVAFGVLHVVFGNFVGVLDKLGRREYKQALTDNLSWLLVFASVPLFLFGWKTAAVAAFLSGFAFLVWGTGILALISLPGMIGNFVSYSRLLALNLTAPGVGMAFNFLASLIWGIPLVGPLFSIALFIVTHTVLLLMAPIGSFIHSLRLHYVEFYGTFYDGGGGEFAPFSEKREYTVIRR